MQTLDSSLQACITLCWQCRTECQKVLFNHCLYEGGAHVEAEHVKVMADCMQACQIAADFMTRNSPLHTFQCEACAAVCDVCAESCAAMDDDDMQRCAEICRRCAASCREMAGMRAAA